MLHRALRQAGGGGCRMSLFIEYPILAAGLGGLCLLLYARSRKLSTAVAALAWLAYGAYETAMRLRWLCTGECNIRVDLLLIYPVLLVISGIAAVSFMRWLLRERQGL
jgi:hypothetical protein